MYILGLGGSLHDYSACLMKDGEILVAIEEERITRQKHAADKNKLQGALENNQVWKYLRTIPKDTLEHAVDYCLEYANITKDDLDLVITTDSNLHLPYVNSFEHLLIINHHMSHMASAYYASDFDDAAILVCDGRGSQITYKGEQGYESVTLAYGSKGKIKILDKVLEHSIGHFYEAVTLALGFGILEDGKVMGLSSYGTDRFVEELGQSYTIEDEKVIFVWSLDEIKDYVKAKIEESDSENLFQTKADLAYAAQKNAEKMVCFYANRLYEMTGCNKLCIAGGVGLNSVANGVIYEKTPFQEMFIQPAAGDNGLSIGCAMYGAYYLSHNKRVPAKNKVYFGRSYDEACIVQALKKFSNLEYEKCSDIHQKTAGLIAEGNIIGWLQGRAEFGPRALGDRSILADPRRADMKDIINAKVKFREFFRPFAPSVLWEYQQEYFELDIKNPYMLIVRDVTEDKRKVIPAVTHVDNSGRLQTVIKEENPDYYKLIEEFRKIAGVPVVLDTSFNIKGEPIVETPEDAIRCFLGTQIDILVLGNYLVKKKEETINE